MMKYPQQNFIKIKNYVICVNGSAVCAVTLCAVIVCAVTYNSARAHAFLTDWPVMHLNLYLFKQFLATSMMVLASLVGVVWLNHALRMLEFVVSKDSSFTDFILLSLFPVPLWLVVALPMAGFIGVIWVISRFLSDRELIVMQAIGLSPLQFGRMPALFGLFLTGCLYINSVYLLPASFSEFKNIQTKVRNSIPKLLIQDNIFIDIADDLTLFVGERISANEVGRVFIQDARNPDSVATFTSERGQFSTLDGRPVFLLRNGQRTELNRDGQSGAQLTFDTHTLDISQQVVQNANKDIPDVNEDTIINLLNPRLAPSEKYARERMAMGHYRLSSPLLGLAMCILAAAVMLQGRILRESMVRRVFIAAVAGIGLQTVMVLARSAAVSLPALWPLMYLCSLIPIGIGVLLLWKPFFLSSLRRDLVAGRRHKQAV